MMARRKTYKRSRQKHVRHEPFQGSIEEKSRAIQKAFNLDEEILQISAKIPQQERSPEAVLFEAQDVDLLNTEELSPQLVPKLSRVAPNLGSLEADPEQDIVKETVEFEADHDIVSPRSSRLTRDTSAEFVKIDNEVFNEAGTTNLTDKCFALEKTLSLNDELKYELNGGESTQRIGSSSTTLENDLRTTPRSESKIPYGYVSEPIMDENCFPKHETLLDSLRPIKSECTQECRQDSETFKDEDHSLERDDCKGFQFAAQSFQDARTNRFANNWDECKRVLSSLRQLHMLKVRGKGFNWTTSTSTSILQRSYSAKYKMLDADVRSPFMTSASQNSSYSYFSPFIWSSSRIMDNDRAHYPVDDKAEEVSEDARVLEEPKEMNNEQKNVRPRSTTPCSGSPPPAKRCRTMLKFDDDEENIQKQRLGDPDEDVAFPRAEKRINEEQVFCPTSTVYTKSCWNSCTSESPTTSVLELPAVSDSDGGSQCMQEAECQSATNCQSGLINGDVRQLLNQRRLPQSRLRFIRPSIGKFTAICVWLIRKLLSLVKKGFTTIYHVIVSTVATGKRISRFDEELNQVTVKLRSENERMISTLLEKVNRLSDELVQVRMSTEAALGTLTTEVTGMRETCKTLVDNNDALTAELKKLHASLQEIRSKSTQSSTITLPPPPPPPPPPHPSSFTTQPDTLVPPPPPPPPPPPFPTFTQSPLQPITPTTPNSRRSVRTPARKCSTPLLNRPTITVEDLLKVTLKKAPQNVKENKRNNVPGPKGPVVSLDMLRSVKLKSARRRTNDQNLRSPRSARGVKSRTAPSISLSPIMIGADGTLERILRQVDLNKRGSRRLLSSSTNFRDNDFTREAQSRTIDTIRHSKSQSAIA